MNSPKRAKVLLVGWNAASRDTVGQLLDSGQLPYLRRFVESSVMGTTVTTGLLSAGIVYNSVATGKYADAHGVLGPHEAHPDGTVSKTDSRTRRVKAFWEILSQNDRRCNVVNFPATGPAERVNGVFVSPAFFVNVRASYQAPADVPPDSVCPADKLDALKELVVAQDEIDSQTMALFVPRLQEAEASEDQLRVIAAALAQTLSVHAIATWLMENTEWDVMSVNYPAIEQLAGRFLRFNKPRLDWVDQREFELFSEVGASSVRLCDLLLRRLLELAGDDATVVVYSARGYRPHEQLPRQALSSGTTTRESLCGGEGIFAMRAAGVRTDELIHNVRSLDICPTVLHLAGLAPGADMDGRVLADAFTQPPAELEHVESWDAVPPLRDVRAADAEPATTGFLMPCSLRKAWRIQTENDWRLVRTLLSSSRRELALGLLVQLYYSNPLQVDKAAVVTEALYLAGQVPAALAVMAPIAEAFPRWPIGMLMSGVIALHKGEVYQALDLFEQAGRDNPPIPQLFFYLGDVCMRLNRLPRAETAYRQAAAIDPSFYHGHVGLAEVLYRTQDFQGSAEAALRAVGVDYSRPVGHLALGKAAAELGQMDRAKQAFRTSLEFAPNSPVVQAHLAAAERGEVLRRPSGNAAADAGEQAGDAPVEPTDAQRRQLETGHAAVSQALREVARWLGQYSEDLASADAKVDEYLAANAAARQMDFTPGDDDTGGEGDEVEWTIRPPIPADQPVLCQMFPDIFDKPLGQEVLVIHPSGTDEIRGGVTLQVSDQNEKVVKLGLSVRGQSGATAEDETAELVMTRLLRAAIARSAAGGVKRLVFALREEPGQSALRRCLERLSFEVALMERVQTMGMLAFRDRCLKIVRRYERQHAIPEDARLVRLGEVPYERVDEFLHAFFEDGAGVPPKMLNPWISRVILKGDQIIACMVGYTKEPDIFVAARSCVHADHRQLWATPWVHGDACKDAYDIGLTVIEFCTDEARYPGFVKIARRMEAKEIGRVYTMVLDLVAPWPSQ